MPPMQFLVEFILGGILVVLKEDLSLLSILWPISLQQKTEAISTTPNSTVVAALALWTSVSIIQFPLTSKG